jgi:hypothetical protein
MNMLIVARIEGKKHWALLVASEEDPHRYRVLSYFLTEDAKDIFCALSGIAPETAPL